MHWPQLKKLLGCNAGNAGPTALDIASVTEDSRRVKSGGLFVAARGEHADGHAYARQAVNAGAVAILGDREDLTELEGVPYLFHPQPRRALGVVAHALHGDPSRHMTVIGVTGTNGKSSTVTMTGRALERAGHPCAVFGTLGYFIGNESIEAPHTTPFGEDLANLFASARAAGMSHVAMEVSSHAIDQERIAGIEFRVAAFTNLTQDHLDYHKDMDAYRRAKLRLFECVCGVNAFTVVNLADSSAQEFVQASNVRCLSYGAPRADCRAEHVRLGAAQTVFTAMTPWGKADIVLRLAGLHNVSNALAVIAICGGLGAPLDAIAEGLASVESIAGRFERVDAGQNFQVIVDYAHTDDGLLNVLNAARAICKGRIIVVFGCGGDRDKTKRPKMGMVAAQGADYCIVTSDNPRSEDPERIMLDIEVGVQRSGKRKGEYYEMIPDRSAAIQRGIALAKSGDLVLIAGKGHETYQILGAQRIHFDDREVARAALEAR